MRDSRVAEGVGPGLGLAPPRATATCHGFWPNYRHVASGRHRRAKHRPSSQPQTWTRGTCWPPSSDRKMASCPGPAPEKLNITVSAMQLAVDSRGSNVCPRSAAVSTRSEKSTSLRRSTTSSLAPRLKRQQLKDEFVSVRAPVSRPARARPARRHLRKNYFKSFGLDRRDNRSMERRCASVRGNQRVTTGKIPRPLTTLLEK